MDMGKIYPAFFKYRSIHYHPTATATALLTNPAILGKPAAIVFQL
jgi:hypothetical protein